MWLSGIKYGNGEAPKWFELLRTGVASTGWWGTCHTKPEALNVFFDKVTKVWMIYLKSERDRISNTRFFLFFCKWRFVDVSSLCRPFSYFFFLVFFSWLFFLILCLEFLDFHFSERKFFDFFGVAKVSRIDTQSQKAPELEFSIPRKSPYFILLSHITAIENRTRASAPVSQSINKCL